MQVAFNGLLRWALHLLMTTRVEFLHILGNLPPPPVLMPNILYAMWLLYGHPLLRSWAHHDLPCLAALAMPPGSGMLS